MSYDSLFGTAPPKPPPIRRKRPPWGLWLLVLAVLGAAVVCIPLTRMVGLGLVAVLAVPVAVFWQRERGNAGHWAATAALGVLGAAFLAGGVVTLVNTGVLAPGMPRWAVNLPPSELTQTPDPDQLGPTEPEQGPPPPPAPASPPGAAPGPAKPAPTAVKTAAPKPDQAGPKPTSGPTPKSTHHRDAPAPAREGRGGGGGGDESSSPTTSEQPEVDRSCELGQMQRNPDGTYGVCAVPNGQGGYGWQHGPGDDGYGNY
jgi:hypothetical protein